jgi:glycerol-3-phosphate dehydrogenase
MRTRWPFLSEPTARRLLRAYGLRAERFLGEAQSLDDLGPVLTGDLTAAEVRYLVENEWVESADDILWRRSKLGLTATPEERGAIEDLVAALRRPAAQG